MNARRFWGAAAAAMGIGMVALAVSRGSEEQQPPPGNMQQRCREAAREMTDLRKEIEGIERRLDKTQKAMHDAKGDQRITTMMAMIDEMADERTLITQKVLAYNELVAGHMLEHTTLSPDQAHMAAQTCQVYQKLKTTSGKLEQPDEPKKK